MGVARLDWTTVRTSPQTDQEAKSFVQKATRGDLHERKARIRDCMRMILHVADEYLRLCGGPPGKGRISLEKGVFAVWIEDFPVNVRIDSLLTEKWDEETFETGIETAEKLLGELRTEEEDPIEAAARVSEQSKGTKTKTSSARVASRLRDDLNRLLHMCRLTLGLKTLPDRYDDLPWPRQQPIPV